MVWKKFRTLALKFNGRMIQNELDIRLKPAIENTSSTKVPLDGEIVFVKDTSNTANNNIRIGDGGTTIASLTNFLTLSSGGGATYQTTLNGTSYGDSGGTSLGSWYAPTASGTSGNMLKSNGNNNAPTWDSLENIIGKKTANYVLAGNGTASGNVVVSWQQLSLSSLSDAPNTGTLTLNGTGFSVYSPTASLSKTWYAPESAGTATNLFLKWDTTNSKPIWTTLSNILGSTSGNLLLGDGSTLTKAITTTKINGTSYTALSDTGSAQTQTNSIYAPIDAGSQYALLTSSGSNTAPIWTLPTGAGVLAYSTTSGSEGWSFETIANIPQASTVSAPIVFKSNGNSPLAEYGYLIRATDSKETGANSAMRFNSLATTDNYYPRLVVKSSFDNPISLYKQGSSDPTSADGTLIQNKIIHSSGLISAPPTSSDGNKYLRAVISNGTTTFGWKNGLLENIQPLDYLGYLASHPQTANDSDQLCVTPTTYVGSSGGVGFFRGINGSYGRVSFQGNLNQPVLIQQGIAPTYHAYTTIENKIVTSNGLINAPSTANRYLKWTGSAFTWDTAGSGTVPGIASVNGDNPGLLQVTSDVDPDKVYINEDYSTAIPVFYSANIEGTIEVWKYDKGEDELPYSKGEYIHINRDGDHWQEGDEEYRFEGHYVNIHDIVNGLIRNRHLLALLKDALDNYKPE